LLAKLRNTQRELSVGAFLQFLNIMNSWRKLVIPARGDFLECSVCRDRATEVIVGEISAAAAEKKKNVVEAWFN